MAKFFLTLLACSMLITSSAQELDFTNYYLNYRSNMETYFSPEPEGDIGESELSQAANSEEYLFDRMHSNHGLDALQYFKVLKQESVAIQANHSMNTNFNWSFLGPTNLLQGMHFQGRMECFATSQLNPGVVCYAGSPTSGIWKTTDSGAHWTNITDGQIPMAVGCQEIVMDPLDEKTLYAAIGLSTSLENIHDIEYYGLGIYVTHDSGLTWSPTGVNFDGYSWHDNVWKIVINPTSPLKQYAITNFQVLRTNNGWQTFEVIFGNAQSINEYDLPVSSLSMTGNNAHLTQSCYYKKKTLTDLDVNPLDWNEVIICSVGQESSVPCGVPLCNQFKYHPAEVWKTSNAQALNNAALVWSYQNQITQIAPSNSLVHSIVNVDYSELTNHFCYAFITEFTTNGNANSAKLFKFSQNTWNLIDGNVTNSNSNKWRMEFETSKLNPNELYYASLKPYRYNITNGQETIINGTGGYSIHPDIRDLSVVKSAGNSEILFACDDGGISKIDVNSQGVFSSNFNGQGLNVTQIYGMDVYSENQDFFTGGTQDNSEIYSKNGLFKSELGNDRYDGILHYHSPVDKYFTKYQGIGNNWTSSLSVFNVDLSLTSIFSLIPPSSNMNAFVARLNAPFDRNWQNPELAFVGGTESIGKINFNSPQLFNTLQVTTNPITRIRALKVSKSNPQVMAVAYESACWNGIFSKKLFITKDGGLTWIDLTAPFNSNSVINGYMLYYGINSLEIDPQNPGHIYIGFNGSENSTQEHLRVVEIQLDLSLPIFGILNSMQVINRSQGFPRLPVNDMQFAPTTGKDLIAATDIGVFYCDMNASSPQWANVTNNLPICVVSDIEFDPFHNEIFLSTFGRGYWKSPMSCEAFGEQHITGSSNLVNIPSVATQTIIVDPGATLTVTSTLSFVENAKLIVRPGGKLVVNGGTLTNACENSFWQGVEVQGQSTEIQSSIVQGTVELFNNAVISNARCGIRVCGMISMDPWVYNFSSSGGIVKATSSLFLNNRKDIEFMSYTSHPSLSQFINCRFWVDEYLPTEASLSSRVSLYEISGVEFIDCHFEILPTSNYEALSAGCGILSMLSSPIIKSSWSNETIEPNPDDITASTLYTSVSELADPSTFKNFKYGIRMLGDGSLFNAQVKNSVFIENKFGISIENQSSTLIYRNKFIYPHDSHYQRVGLYLDRCNQYKVERNYFQGNEDALVGSYGIYGKRSAPVANEIYLNDFNMLDVGIAAEGDQADNVGINGGLQILCDAFYKSKFNIAVLAPALGNMSEIAKSQGVPVGISLNDPNNGADNFFGQDPTYSLASDFYNCPSCTPIKYFRHPSPPNTLKPLYISNNISTIQSTVGFVDRWTNCPIDHDLNLNSLGLVQTVNINQLIIDVEKVQYLQLMDGGYPEELLSFVSNLNISSSEIRNALIPISPYLSVVILDTLIDRSSTLNPWHLTEILIACSPLDPIIMRRLDILPSYMFDLVSAYQTGENTKLLQEFRMKSATTNKLRGLAKLIEVTVDADSLLRDFTPVKNLLSDNSDFVESRMLYDIYLAEHNYVAAQTQYTNFLTNYYDINENQLNLLILEINSNGGFSRADSTYKSEIQNYVALGGNIGDYAKSLLELLGDSAQEPVLQYPNLLRSTRETESSEPKKIQLLHVFPNPVKDEFSVGFILPSENNQSYLNVYNETGSLVIRIDISKSNGVQYVNATSWSSGLYVVELIVNGRIAESQKIIVKHEG